MTRQQHLTLARFLSEFVETHPGTRFGRLFGRPAAFVGTGVFADVTNEGLRCRLPREVAGRGSPVRARLHSGPYRGWLVITADAVVRTSPLLELSAMYAATGVIQRRRRSASPAAEFA